MTKEEFLNFEEQRKGLGLSIPNFSIKCNISKYTYYHYKRKYIGKTILESKNNFIKIEVPVTKPKEVSNKVEIEMRTSFGTEIRLKGAITSEMLSAIIIASKNTTNV